MSWILTANRTGARILDKQGNQLSLVETIEHPEGRLRDSDINSDRPGRSFESASATRHALGSSEAPHEHVARSFARLLADKLRRARLARSFEGLVLVAEPHLLGLLRDELDPPTARMVIASVPKDLAGVPVGQLLSHLPELPHQVL